MPHAEGSIADYDLVLSISAEAINRQLKVLYDTKIKDITDLPPPKPTKINGAMPAPQTEHLINHRLDIHIDKKGKPNPKLGLSAFIECPTIEFDNLASKVNDYRTAKVSIKFKREGNVDSTFTEANITEEMTIELEETNVTGWTMSWEVKLGRADIEDVMTELIEPAKSEDSSVVLHPETSKALEGMIKDDGVDSRKFLVSSIFCVIQAAQFANTFELRDATNRLLPMQESPGGFMLTVSKYFTGMQVKPGRMTPDNPFVLGYGISQTLPDIKELKSDVNLDLTPRYLVPKSFQITCTPGTTSASGSRYTMGTLNFCILTHRDAWPNSLQEQPGRDTNGEKNPSAGVLERTLFDTTRTSAHDGVMAFCKELIYDKYICGNLARRFLMNPLSIAEGLYGIGMQATGSPTSTWSSGNSARPPTLTLRHKFTTGYKNDADEVFMRNRRWAQGETWVELSMTSDLLENPTSLTNLDAKRRTYIDITYGADITCRNQTQGKVGSLWDVEKGWSTQYWASLNMKYNTRLIVEAGQVGVWSVSRDPNTTLYHSPQYEENGTLLKIEREKSNGRFGAFATGDKGDKPEKDEGGTGWWNLFGTAAGMYESMRQVNLGLSKPTAAFEENVTKSLGELKQTILMPAGEAFLFTGIDCDEKGNLYSHITYHQGARGASKKK